MPFGYGGGPWWLYNRGGYGRCFRSPWLPRWWWTNPQQDYTGAYPGYTAPTAPTKEQELEILENNAKMLKEELTEIEKRVKELEEKEE